MTSEIDRSYVYMPILSVAVPELESHVYYPVIKTMAHSVINNLGLDKVIGKNIYIDTGFSQPKRYRTNHNAVLQINKLNVQAEINTNPASLKWDNISFQHALEPIGFSHTTKDRDFQIVFYDPTSNIKISEMYLPTYISMNCTLSILDRSLAYQIPSMLYRHYPPNMPSMEHLAYDYPIPKSIIALIYTLYKLKRFHKPDSFRKWLDMCSGHNTQFDINRVATKEELVMKKILIDSLFMLEYSDNKPNEEQINRTVSEYRLNFQMHIQFSRPDTMLIDYPIVIDNQLLPEGLVPAQLHKSQPIPNLIGPFPANILNEHIARDQLKYTRPVMVKFPDYDDWVVPITSFLIQRSYRPWFSSVFTMDEDSEYTVLPMGGVLDEELGYRLHPIVKDILRIQGVDSFRDDCVFNIAVFVDDIPAEPTYLDIDDDLNVKVKCLHKSVVRRIVISEISDLKYLNSKWTYLYQLYRGLIAKWRSIDTYEEKQLIQTYNTEIIAR